MSADLIQEYCRITGRHISTISVEEFLCFKGYERKYTSKIKDVDIRNNRSHILYEENVTTGEQDNPDRNYYDQSEISGDKDETIKVTPMDTQTRQSKANMMAMLRSVKG